MLLEFKIIGGLYSIFIDISSNILYLINISDSLSLYLCNLTYKTLSFVQRYFKVL